MPALRALAFACVGMIALGAAGAASAALIVDKSGLPVFNNANTLGNNGGVQFFNHTDFVLESVRILLGSENPTTFDFQIIQFDGPLGDTTGTVIGTVPNVPVGGLTFDDFASDSAFVDTSSLGLTLLANTVYGFAFHDTDPSDSFRLRGGSTGPAPVGDTDTDVGSIFSGDGAGTLNTLFGYEVPFQANGTFGSGPDPVTIPEPSALALFFVGLLGLGTLVRRRRPGSI